MPELVPDPRLELVAATQLDQAPRHRDVRVQWIGAGRECIGIGVIHDPDPRPRHAGRDGHLFDHVDQLLLLWVSGIDDFTRPRGPEHLLGARRVRIPRRQQGDDRERDPEPREDVVVRRNRGVASGQVVDVIPAEPEPCEKCDEANHQQDCAPAIGFLLLKEVERGVVAHTFGFIERSTCGTAFSA